MARETLPKGTSLMSLAGGVSALNQPAATRPEASEAEPAAAAEPKVAARTIQPPEERADDLPPMLPIPPAETARADEADEEATPISRPAPRRAGRATPAPRPLTREPKVKFNARLPMDLAEQVKDCVFALSGPAHQMTVEQFAEQAYRRELERMKRAHNSGQEFPQRSAQLRTGRRVA